MQFSLFPKCFLVRVHHKSLHHVLPPPPLPPDRFTANILGLLVLHIGGRQFLAMVGTRVLQYRKSCPPLPPSPSPPLSLSTASRDASKRGPTIRSKFYTAHQFCTLDYPGGAEPGKFSGWVVCARGVTRGGGCAPALHGAHLSYSFWGHTVLPFRF
jgi:hypothetical protein